MAEDAPGLIKPCGLQEECDGSQWKFLKGEMMCSGFS